MGYKVKNFNIHLIVIYVRAYTGNKGKLLFKEWLRFFPRLKKGTSLRFRKSHISQQDEQKDT